MGSDLSEEQPHRERDRALSAIPFLSRHCTCTACLHALGLRDRGRNSCMAQVSPCWRLALGVCGDRNDCPLLKCLCLPGATLERTGALRVAGVLAVRGNIDGDAESFRRTLRGTGNTRRQEVS